MIAGTVLAMALSAEIRLQPIEATKAAIPLRTYFCSMTDGSRDFYVVEFEYHDGKNIFNVRRTKSGEAGSLAIFSSAIEKIGDHSEDGGVTFVITPKGQDAEVTVRIDSAGKSTAELKLKGGAIDRPCSQVPNIRKESE